ncbi:hypothetical protein GOBAR_DD33640 [Gossypium barbadense]|nr:hypothetical protein GOBAR_DD33640 [Gossypium barbadense]
MEAGHMFVEDVKDAMVVNHRMTRSMNVEVYSRCLERFELWRPSVVDLVYHLGPMELIFETSGAIVGGSKHFIIHMHMLWQRVLKSRSMLNNLSMMYTHSSTRCVSGRLGSPSYLTCLRERCLRWLSSLSQTKGCGYISAGVDVHVVGDCSDQHPLQSQVGVREIWKKNYMPRTSSMNLSWEECHTMVDTTQEEWSTAVDTSQEECCIVMDTTQRYQTRNDIRVLTSPGNSH